MRKLVITSFFCLILVSIMGVSGIAASKKEEDIRPPGENEVHIAPDGVMMPLGRILLVRKDADYCAIKFTKFWTGKNDDDRYATYEAYYQDDKTGDFTNKNAKFCKNELHSPIPSFSLFGHPVSFGAKKEVQCGRIRLWWTGLGSVYFFKRYQQSGDYGVEFAPTKWEDILQVNVFDKRLKWYRYDGNRKRVNVPVEQLWDDKDR
jgi:hypothetical protein